jgi:Cd2+/Zn2+-exporting ATPase
MDMEQKHDCNHHDHNHEHGGIFGKNTELIFSLICGGLLAAGFALSLIIGSDSSSVSSSVTGISSSVTVIQSLSGIHWLPLAFYIVAYFFGGFYTAKEAIENIRSGTFDIDSLMLVAAVGAAILGDWAEGALLLFLFSLGHSLEHYAMNKARKSISALADLAPKTAWLKDGKEVGIEQLKPGDIIVVKPNTKIPADGTIVQGNSSVNQAPITGESMPVEKQVNSNVFAGSINGNGSLEIKVSKPASDSTIARLIKLVNEGQKQKSPTQRFTDKLQKVFVPVVLVSVVLLCFAFLVMDETFSQSFYRAMSVLVAASPCALAISTPSAVLSGVARAAREGVLIKGGRPLEDLGTITALAFDKTGTLTAGKPRLTNVLPVTGISEEELLQAVVAVEALSDHPLAKALVADGTEKLKGNTTSPVAEELKDKTLPPAQEQDADGTEELKDKTLMPAQDLEAIQGKGVKAKWQNSTIYIGNRIMFDNALPAELNDQLTALESKGNTSMIVKRDDQYLGIITMMDTPREEAKAALQRLKETGIRKMIMLSGDSQQVADAIAKEIGLTDAWGNLLPEQKVASIKKLIASEGKVAMVGDGVNDAPAMANSTVGIAMGAAGSDVALETADIALMGDRLDKLPFAIALSRKANAIIKQNLFISLGMVVVLIPLTLLGIASIGPAVIAHEGSTILVVFNALRLLVYNQKS